MISQTSGKTKYLKNSIYRQQLVVKLELFDLCVLLIFFSQEGKINWCAADFFSCLSCGQKKVLLWTIPNSDVPALLGCKPNTFLPSTNQGAEWGLRIYKRTPMQIFFVAPRYILLLSLKWYLARCPWICFGFEPQRWVHFEGFSTGIRNSLMNNWVGWWVGGWKSRKWRVEQQMEFYL